MNDVYGMLLLQALSSDAGLDLEELIPLLAGNQKDQAEGGDEVNAKGKKEQIGLLLKDLESDLKDFRKEAARADDKTGKANARIEL